jgi:hypothetical protein
MKLVIPLVCDSVLGELERECRGIEDDLPLLTSVRIDGEEGTAHAVVVSEIDEHLPEEPLKMLLTEHLRHIETASKNCISAANELAEELLSHETADSTDEGSSVLSAIDAFDQFLKKLYEKTSEIQIILRELEDPDDIN